MIDAPLPTGRISAPRPTGPTWRRLAGLAVALSTLFATPAIASRPDLYIALAQPITPPHEIGRAHV